MATNNIKMARQEESLSDTNIKKVIGMLEPTDGSKPCTKTLACATLCISYNVARLDKLINKFKEDQAFRERKMKENRGKPATQDEIQYAIKEYMHGNSVTQIARELFRGVGFINNILESHDVPVRPRVQDYFRPELIPEGSVRTWYEIGEKVYSARYDSLAMIKSVLSQKHDGENVYSIYLMDECWNMYAYQPASELASLESLTKMGIKL